MWSQIGEFEIWNEIKIANLRINKFKNTTNYKLQLKIVVGH
jgi:hypothetical protein